MNEEKISFVVPPWVKLEYQAILKAEGISMRKDLQNYLFSRIQGDRRNRKKNNAKYQMPLSDSELSLLAGLVQTFKGNNLQIGDSIVMVGRPRKRSRKAKEPVKNFSAPIIPDEVKESLCSGKK